MKLKSVILIFLVVIWVKSQTVSELDFILGAVNTGSYMWTNFVGASFQYDNIKDYLNSTLFQGYILNSNVRGSWYNNWVVSLKTPLGHKYNCSALSANVTNPNVVCTFETQGNATYWSVLGEFVWNTQNQPNWCITYDMQGSNFNLASHLQVYYNWLFQVFKSTYSQPFCDELVDYGDKMVERGYKTSYTPDDFIKDINRASSLAISVAHSGPGITDSAPKEWLMVLQKFHEISRLGHFTVRCVVFPDPSKVNIQSILSDNATKYYLRDRFKINDTYAYSDFSKTKLGINDIRLTTGEGVDGVTNTFAAAIWALDIILEFMLMNSVEIDFNHEIREGNFQSILGTDFKPSPIYYGMLFAVFIRHGTPEIILPSTKALLSSRIKAYGLSDGETFKVLLLNKDTNASLNGTVLVKSKMRNPMKCIYMQAPSLDSKDNITIGGNYFIGGNAEAQGQFRQKKVLYNEEDHGYHIPIKYAQAVVCETPDSKFTWPNRVQGANKSGRSLLSSLSLLALLLLVLLH